MSSSIAEIMALSNPRAYTCKIWSYAASHSRLLIRVHKDDFAEGASFYLLFEGVLYIEGATTWHGVGLQIGLPEESLQLLRSHIGRHENIPDEYILERIMLFKFITSSGTVKILASGLHKSKNIPPDFSWLTK